MSSRLVALLGLFLAPALLGAQTQDELQRSIVMVNQEIELLKATVDATFDEAERGKAEHATLHGRIDELGKRLKDLQLQLDRKSVELAEQGQRVDELADEVEQRLKRFDLFGSLRARSIFEMNRTDLTSKARDRDLYFQQRLRLGVAFHPVSQVTVTAELEDSRVWGHGGAGVGLSDELSELAMYRGFVTIRGLVEGLSLDAGRLTLSYGQQRVIAAPDWLNRGRAFDGARLSYAPVEGLTLDLLYTVLREQNVALGRDSTFGGFYGSYAFAAGPFRGLTLDAYALHLYDGRPEAYKNLATLGLLLHGTLFEALYLDVEAIVQVGKVTEALSTTKNDHLATAGYAGLGYVSSGTVPFKVGAFASGASGDAEPRDVPGNTRSVSFIPLFPALHTWWGLMDLVSWTNLMEFGVEAEVTPAKGLTASLQYHEYFAVDDRAPFPILGSGNAPLKAMGKHMGGELDLVLAWQPLPWLRADTGYGLFLPAEGARNYKGLGDTSPAHWFYLQGKVTL
jgi:hypothetical protein